VLAVPVPFEKRKSGRGVRGEFRPPRYKFWAKSVRIFSKAHRQSGLVFTYKGFGGLKLKIRLGIEQNPELRTS